MNLPPFVDGKKIISEISSGGHAIVYKAWDATLETHYAIKVMRPEAVDNADRFLTEAKVLAQIKHPNVPSIFNYGRIDECPFIRMEFVDGEDLGNILASKQKLPLTVAVSIIVQVARALQFAHTVEYEIYGEKRKGIIHRDVKPGNILVGRDGTVKLTDFGIAKVDKLSIHTSSTSILGTPYYMSPEQLDPPDDGEQLDSRSDIYSLGCVLYECLTGKCQFDATTITVMLNRKKTGKYNLAELKSFPKNVRKIIATATEVEKESRYADINQMLKALESILTAAGASIAEVAVKNYLETGEYRHFNRFKRNTKVLVLIIAGSLSAVGGGAWVFNYTTKNRVKGIPSVFIPSTKDTIKIMSPVSTGTDIVDKINQVTIESSPQKPAGNYKRRISQAPQIVVSSTAIDTSSTRSTFELFRKGRYDDVVRQLSLKQPENLSDSLFLAFCGALSIQNPDKAGEIVFSRSIQDGYYHYLRGRYYYSKGKWELARSWFLKSLTIPSIIPCEEPLQYYLVKCADRVLKEKPNIGNREFFAAQRKEYLEKFCGKNGKSEACREVQSLP